MHTANLEVRTAIAQFWLMIPGYCLRSRQYIGSLEVMFAAVRLVFPFPIIPSVLSLCRRKSIIWYF